MFEIQCVWNEICNHEVNCVCVCVFEIGTRQRTILVCVNITEAEEEQYSLCAAD